MPSVRTYMRFSYFAALALFVIGGTESHAQDTTDPNTAETAAEVSEQNALNDVDAYPLHVGSFEVLPKLKVTTEYIDNVFAEDSNEDSDIVFTVAPELNVQKKIRDHEFNFNTAGAVIRYADNKDENIENFGASFFGHLTAYSSLRIPFLVSYLVDHTQRNINRELFNSQEPTKRSSFKGEIGLEYKPNRFFINNYLRHEQRRFEDGRNSLGATLVREDGDFDSVELETRIGYETSTKWVPFIGLTVGENDYLRRTFDGTGFNGTNRDNKYFSAVGGLAFNYKGLLVGEVGIGRSHVDYDDASVDNISALALQGSARWQFLERAVLELDLSRQVKEDNLLNTGIVETDLLLGLDYELDRDLFLNSFIRLQNDDFDVGGREDDILTGKLGLYYIINPRFQLEGSVTHRQRESNVDGGDYDQNIFMMSLQGSL